LKDFEKRDQDSVCRSNTFSHVASVVYEQGEFLTVLQVRHLLLLTSYIRLPEPVAVATRSKHEPSSPARTLGSWVRIPLKGWMSVCVYSVCVVLCVGSGLATG
jgi:hypothetical protein